MTTYIAVDVGNVLVHVDFKQFLNRLSQALNISMQDAELFLATNQKTQDLGISEMLPELRDRLGVKSEPLAQELARLWIDAISPADWLLEEINVWRREHDVIVAILSNVGVEHTIKMSQILGELFRESVKHLSFQVGARKPTFLYYQSFLAMHPEFQGCIFIDDRPENLEASRLFGFRPLHFALDDFTRENYDEGKFRSKMSEIERAFTGQNCKYQICADIWKSETASSTNEDTQ